MPKDKPSSSLHMDWNFTGIKVARKTDAMADNCHTAESKTEVHMIYDTCMNDIKQITDKTTWFIISDILISLKQVSVQRG